MKRTLDELRGALHDEADGTAYPDVEAMLAGAGRRVAALRRRRLAALSAATAAVLVVAGLAITRPTHQALLQPAGRGTSGPATDPAASARASAAASAAARAAASARASAAARAAASARASAAASAAKRSAASAVASQSAADAVAFGIDPAVAAAPIGVRVFQPDPADWPAATTQASTPEGLWLVSAPDQFSADISAYPELTQYGELLLLTPDRSRIVRAYPFRGLPPQWLLVTPEAVYCGRQGDGGLPDSMVCRVDRTTGALGVAVFPSTVDTAFGDPQALAGRPGGWRLAGSQPGTDFQHVPRLTADGLVLAADPNQAGGGRPLRLDPVTLK